MYNFKTAVYAIPACRTACKGPASVAIRGLGYLHLKTWPKKPMGVLGSSFGPYRFAKGLDSIIHHEQCCRLYGKDILVMPAKGGHHGGFPVGR
jgi:hypothetical protein